MTDPAKTTAARHAALTIEQLERSHARLMARPLRCLDPASREYNARECLRVQRELDRRLGRRWVPTR